jgi:hypothetical protein
MKNGSKWIASAALATLLALYLVGAFSHGVLRHIVQTLPLWISIVLGFRGRELAKWAALPCMAIWLLTMSIIWLFLLGWARLLSGHFTPLEVAMTLVVGASCLSGIVQAIRWKTSVRPWVAWFTALLCGIFQLLAMRISFIPFVATH